MADTGTVGRTDGVVLPSNDVVARYRADGLWNDTLLHELVLQQVTRRPAAVALVDGDRRMTYRELGETVHLLASRLFVAGLCRGDRVLLRLPNSLELVITLLALMRLGARPVLAAPVLREWEISRVVKCAAPRAIVVHATRRSGYSLGMARRLYAQRKLRHVLVLGDMPVAEDEIDLRALLRRPGEPPPAAQGAPVSLQADALFTEVRDAPDDVALYLLSSGTTGLPKPIPRTHQDYGYSIRVNVEICEVNQDTVFLAALPIAHTFTLGCPGVLGVLATGGRVVVAQQDPETMLDLIAREQVTMTASVPALAVQLAATAEATARDLSSLRLIQVGGARLSSPDAQRLLDSLGCRVQQVYGMSEGLQYYTRLDDPPDVVRQTQGRPASPATEWRIVDDHDRDVQSGESGELLARGPHLIRGYLAPAEINERAFTADGYFRTGDIVRLHPSGNVVFEGRRIDFVNVCGEKVSAHELEELLLQHPAIAQCVVVPMPYPSLGEAVCVFAVAAKESAVSLREIRAFLDRAGVARFKFPARLELVAALPTTAMGKPDRAALRRDIAERVTQGQRR